MTPSIGSRALAAAAALCVVLALVAASCSGGDGAAGDDRSPTVLDGNAAPGAGTEPVGAEVPPRPSSGCDGPAPEPVWEEQRWITVDGTDRWYLVTVPETVPAPEGPLPLVLDFHGLAEGATFHTITSGYSDLAETHGFVVAYPNGTGMPVSWDIAPDSPDALFVESLLEELAATLCIDEARTYAIGMSNGALFASMLGCTRAETFAAVALVAGVAFPEGCDPGTQVPVMAFHGTADPILVFNGGVGEALGAALAGDGVPSTTMPAPDLDGHGHPAAARAWAQSNGCRSAEDVEWGESVVVRTWDCPDNGETTFLIVVGGGHTWPGSDALTNPTIAELVGPTTFEIDASEASWEFFTRHARG